MSENLKNKKVLQMGLGILGGGVATARWLVAQGADLTVTDTKDETYLAPSLEKLKDLQIKYVLGKHEEKDFLENEIIVVNPDVPIDSKFIKLSKENGKQIENELSLFYRFCRSNNTVGITGTRGKTTTVNWTAHLLQSKIIGNSPLNPFLGDGLNCKEDEKIVLEVPSFQLELLGEHVDSQNSKLAPHVAVITNLYRDHINRHKSMEGYAVAKANIFKYQNSEDFLILNKEDVWTEYFLSLKPKSKILFFSKDDNYNFVDKDEFIKKWGEHNLLNLYASILVARVLGVSDEEIKTRIFTLPQIKFRQEKVFEGESPSQNASADRGKVEIFNDTTATSPEATIAGVQRFRGEQNFFLISGGTDRDLEFTKWAEAVKGGVKPENLILLSGSATEKMKMELGFEQYNEFDSLSECFKEALRKSEEVAEKSVILFSPSSKSFEKFKNEFDRGEQFNAMVENLKRGII